MAHNNEAFEVMDRLTANITPYTYFQTPEDREALVQATVAGEHVLFGGEPGGGKTTIAKAIAGSLDLSFGRFQGDPMATTRSVIGSRIFDQSTGKYDFIPGPIFNDVFLADEFNRNSGQTQAAVIEGMQERQVTLVNGETRLLSPNFFVMATQNMKDKTDGINQLTEANRDRFGIYIDLSKEYNEQDELAVGKVFDNWEDTEGHGPEAITSEDELIIAKRAIRRIRRESDPDRLRHAQWLVMAVREHPQVDKRESLLKMGRPALTLIRMAAARAASKDRATLQEVDINKSAKYVLGSHRVEPTLKAQRAGITAEDIVSNVIDQYDLDLTD